MDGKMTGGIADRALNGRKPLSLNSWACIALSGIIFFIVMGIRQTIGLFVLPIVANTNINFVEVSTAIAIGQLVWGIFQPVCGAVADKKGPFPVLLIGLLCLAAGEFGAAWADSPVPFVLMFGLLSPAGAAAGSFAVLFGIMSARLPSGKRSLASGIINTGGALGQFTFAPLVQLIINIGGYCASLVFLAASALLAIVPSWFLCGRKLSPKAEEKVKFGAANHDDKVQPETHKTITIKEQLRIAFHNPSYIILHLSFFTCGFHVSFLAAHLPGEININGYASLVSALCISIIGVSNIVGSISVGILGKHFFMKHILVFVYASRVLLIGLYLAVPKTEPVFYVFAVLFGLSWVATVPPTSGLVAKLFGIGLIATLVGLVSLTHQIGAFLSAWLGGIAMQRSGSLLPVWYIDMVLAAFAALICLFIDEKSLQRDEKTIQN
jgi:predicted MFS family arabinose efflux permease